MTDTALYAVQNTAAEDGILCGEGIDRIKDGSTAGIILPDDVYDSFGVTAQHTCVGDNGAGRRVNDHIIEFASESGKETEQNFAVKGNMAVFGAVSGNKGKGSPRYVPYAVHRGNVRIFQNVVKTDTFIGRVQHLCKVLFAQVGVHKHNLKAVECERHRKINRQCGFSLAFKRARYHDDFCAVFQIAFRLDTKSPD